MEHAFHQLCERYGNREWEIVDRRAERVSDGTMYMDVLLHLKSGDKVIGFSFEESIEMNPDAPYTLAWNLIHTIATYPGREAAISALISFVDRYERTHDFWTEDVVTLYYIPSLYEAEVVFHAGLTGNLVPQEEHRGITFSEEQKQGIANVLAARRAE